MEVLTEPDLAHGVVLPHAAGVARIIAPNPGPMTCHGTNTWLVRDAAGGITVIDPGPDDARHLAAVLRAAESQVTRILLTHGHLDHVGAAAALAARTGAPVHGFAAPHANLADGDRIAGLRVIHTPGHAPDHLCFEAEDGTVFTGDHVMGWSTTVVSPPQGDMTDYIASLRRLRGRGHVVYLPGHGPAVADPEPFLRALLGHRLAREQAILRVLGHGPATVEAIAARLYAGLAATLLPAARESVHAHLLKLRRENRALCAGGAWRLAG